MNERRRVWSVRFVFYRVERFRRLWVTHTRIHTLTDAASARARAEFLMANRCIGEEWKMGMGMKSCQDGKFSVGGQTNSAFVGTFKRSFNSNRRIGTNFELTVHSDGNLAKCNQVE